MAKLNKNESAQLMTIMEKPGWSALEKLAAMTVNELNAMPASGTNAFEVLRSVHRKDAKVEALKEFFEGVTNGTSLTA